MKKILSLVLAVLMLTALMGVPAFAEETMPVALNETGLRGDRLRGDAAGAQFSALFVKNCCLGGGSAIVESDVITHTVSLLSVVDKHQVRCRFSVQLTVFSLYHMIVPEMTDFRPVSA